MNQFTFTSDDLGLLKTIKKVVEPYDEIEVDFDKEKGFVKFESGNKIFLHELQGNLLDLFGKQGRPIVSSKSNVFYIGPQL